VGVAGVFWLNLPASSAPASLEPAPAVLAPEPFEPPPAPQPIPPEGAFKYLETPPPEGNEPAGFLLEGRRVLAAELRGPARPPALHPDQWQRLPAVPGPPPTGLRVAVAPPQAPPPLDFLIETSAGREAWIKGVGYRPGATLEGGYRLNRITATGVVLGGPSGEVERPLRAGGKP
jgi:hypothetical protein